MGLAEYRKKRRFSTTPEPAGADPDNANHQYRFVIQKHAARNLHYDLRLELDGVLLSWAVPKGPSLDPDDKRLAIHVEDHPLEYLHFEGIIPQGEYGGGTVLVWDTGTWRPLTEDGYESGDLKFELDGDKLQGRWMLVHTGKRKKTNQWLFFKERDEAARPAAEFDVLAAHPESVLSGRTIEQVAADADAVWTREDSEQTKATKKSRSRSVAAAPARLAPKSLKRSVRKPLPARLLPMLPTAAKDAPTGDKWVHEIKYDGYRMLAWVVDKQTTIRSRNGHNWTDKLPKLADQLARLPVKQAIMDGEVVFLTENGRTDFQALQNTIGRGDDRQLYFYAFDLLYLDGYDLTACPLLERKRMLAQLVPHEPAEFVLFSEHIEGDGPLVFEQAARLGAEGIVSKLAGGKYVEGRTRDWLKTKSLQSAEFVLGGFTESSSAQPFGSLIVGAYDAEGQLVYLGRVGTGFNARSMTTLAEAMLPWEVDEAPFVNAGDCQPDRPTHWLAPSLAVEVEYGGWTRDRMLRFPSYRGLRDDIEPASITLDGVQEQGRTDTGTRAGQQLQPTVDTGSAAMSDVRLGDLSQVHMTHPDRVMYPQAGITKEGIATYYAQVAARILPHWIDRPLALVRCPKGCNEKCFFQKSRAKGMPDALREVKLSKDGKKTQQALVLRDLAGVIALVQFSVLEVHVWGCKVDKPNRPDRIIFDLDPDESLPFDRVTTAALMLRELLAELELVSFVKTTGGKGLHVVLPIRRTLTWDQASGFALGMARQMVARSPGRFTTNVSKASRRGKIYVDYLRNKFGATAIAPYSTRARPTAAVAVPLAWDELATLNSASAYTVANLSRRLEHLTADPWATMESVKQTITKQVLGVVH